MAALSDLGVLSLYLADPIVTEVAVNHGNEVWVDRSGRMERVDSIDGDELVVLIERITAPLGLRFDLTSPIVDARLPDGHRVCAVREPLAVGGTCLSVRRFALRTVSLDAFAPPAVAALLHDLVTSRCNLVVSGATSTGKTTLLNAVAALCDPNERIITIEDTAELDIASPHVVRLEARPATPDGVDAITVRQLLHAALRLRPDRLVIGEVRGEEAYDMVQALNTGHDGSLSTVHANSPQDALRRIASLAALGAPGQPRDSLDDQVRSSIDVIVHLIRRSDGTRCVSSVEEVHPPGEPGPPTTVLATASEVIAKPSRLRQP
jgi:pilus assembly protein CpaF